MAFILVRGPGYKVDRSPQTLTIGSRSPPPNFRSCIPKGAYRYPLLRIRGLNVVNVDTIVHHIYRRILHFDCILSVMYFRA